MGTDLYKMILDEQTWEWERLLTVNNCSADVDIIKSKLLEFIIELIIVHTCSQFCFALFRSTQLVHF